LNGGVRQDADADTGGDGSAYGFNAGQANAVMGSLSEGLGVAFEVFLEGAALAETDERLVKAFVETNPLAAGEPMLGRGHEHKLVVSQNDVVKLSEVDRAGDDADLGSTFGDGLHDDVAGPLLQIDVDAGMSDEEGDQLGGQSGRNRGGVCQ